MHVSLRQDDPALDRSRHTPGVPLKRDVTTGQAKAMLASVRPRDIAGKTRRRIAAEELAELIAVEAKIKKSTAELKIIVLARGSHLMDLHGVGDPALETSDCFEWLLAFGSLASVVGAAFGVEADLAHRGDVDHVVHPPVPGA